MSTLGIHNLFQPVVDILRLNSTTSYYTYIVDKHFSLSHAFHMGYDMIKRHCCCPFPTPITMLLQDIFQLVHVLRLFCGNTAERHYIKPQSAVYARASYVLCSSINTMLWVACHRIKLHFSITCSTNYTHSTAHVQYNCNETRSRLMRSMSVI